MIYLTLSALIACLLHVGVDFAVFYQAASALAHGLSPYTVAGYYSPIHVAMLFVPLTAFDLETAFRLHSFIALSVFMLGLRRLSTGRVFVLLLASPAIWFSLYFGNVEFWPLLALLLPAPSAMLAALVKPQVGFVLVAWLVWREWRTRGPLAAMQLAAPAVMILGASLVMGLRFGAVIMSSWNASLWPLSILPGLVLMGLAWTRKSTRLALAAGPCLSPYVNMMSWVAVMPAAARSIRWTAVIVMAQWISVFTLRVV